MKIFFVPNEEVLDQYLKLNVVNLENVNCNHDYDTCMSSYVIVATTIKASLSLVSSNQVYDLPSLLLVLV